MTGNTVELSMNEPLDKLKTDVRGIIFPDGNFITGRNTKVVSFNHWPVIHYEIYCGYTNENISDAEFNDRTLMFQWLDMQRKGMSNMFYLGESYEMKTIDKIKSDPDVIDMVRQCQQNNIDKKFVLESIRMVR